MSIDFHKKKYTYDELLEIIAMLRSENGCPWDKVQTHEKPCMMEEAAELLASIRYMANLLKGIESLFGTECFL